MAKMKDALDATGATTAPDDTAPQSAPPGAAASADATPTGAAPAETSTPAPVQEFIDPHEELQAAQERLRKAVHYRTLRETIDVFNYVRNIRWGVSTVNGVPVDLNNPIAQWDKQKHIRAASWVEVATVPSGFNLDIRGKNNQLWYTRAPARDEKGEVVKRYDPLPVKGFSDDDLPPPNALQTHWLEKIRPDLVARRERLFQRGVMVSLPALPSNANDIGTLIESLKADLDMADMSLAAVAKGK